MVVASVLSAGVQNPAYSPAWPLTPLVANVFDFGYPRGERKTVGNSACPQRVLIMRAEPHYHMNRGSTVDPSGEGRVISIERFHHL